MQAQTGDNQACTLKTPPKGWKMYAEEIWQWLEIMVNEARLKIFGDNIF